MVRRQALNYLAFGYTGVQDEKLALHFTDGCSTWGQQDVTTAQVIGKVSYFGSLDAMGARQVAREFAADILQQFGAKSLAGTKIYFVSDRSGAKEIWSMDYDGTNQKQLTRYNSTSNMPAVSPDGSLVAFTTYAGGNPQIRIHSVVTGRRVPFYNPVSSVVETPEFTPDGKQLLFTQQPWTDGVQICISGTDGSGFRRISNVRSIGGFAEGESQDRAPICCSFPGRSGRQQVMAEHAGRGRSAAPDHGRRRRLQPGVESPTARRSRSRGRAATNPAISTFLSWTWPRNSPSN